VPVNDNNAKDPMTTSSAPPSVLDAEPGDLLAALATTRSVLTHTVSGLRDEQAGEQKSTAR
jgi:hypothetical protein